MLQKALVKGVGLSLVFANWAMARIQVLSMFLTSTILLGILLILLIYSNIALLVYHAPTYSRPFDMALVHAPLRFFMVLPLSLLFPYSLFITLGLTMASSRSAWAGFAVVMSTNVLSLIVILLRRDIIWAIAATWICISIWTAAQKPAPVFVPVVLFTVLHPIALISVLVYDHFARRQGHIALPSDEAEREGTSPTDQRGPREIDVERVWGS